VFTEGGTGARYINGILSLLIKEYYPGLDGSAFDEAILIFMNEA
jgi:hypothetical protein